MKNLLKSRTIWLAIVQGAIGILTAALTTDPNLHTVAGLLILKSALDVVLRLLTDTAVTL